jgi:hypothetical protein
MTPEALGSRILAAVEGETSTPAGDRRRAVAVLYWLQVVAASDAGLSDADSGRTIARHRASLKKTGLVPAEHPVVLADICQALGVRADNTAAIARLAWALRGSTGQMTRQRFSDAIAPPLLAATAAALRRL